MEEFTADKGHDFEYINKAMTKLGGKEAFVRLIQENKLPMYRVAKKYSE
jgi:hypothetical protein